MYPNSAPIPEERTPGPDPSPRRDHAPRPRLALLVLVVLIGIGALGYDRLLKLQREAAAVEAQARQAELDARLQQKKQAAAEANAARQKALAEAEAARRRAEAEAQARREAARQAALQAEAERRKRERDAYERDAEPVVAALENLESRLHGSVRYREYLDLLDDVARQAGSLAERYENTRFARSLSYREIGLSVKAYYGAFEAWKLQNNVDESSAAYDEAESLVQRSWSLGGECVQSARAALRRHN